MPYKPKKQLGQNFLKDKMVIENTITKSGLKPSDVVLEIGPGQGSLTYALSQKVKKVIAVEKDEKLYRYLLNKFEKTKNIEFVNEDILEFLELSIMNYELWNKRFIIVGNIPYYLTSFLLRSIFKLKNKPSAIILMVQKEVAERLVAKKGEMNLLAISVQIFAEPEILFNVSKKSFWPEPKVDSSVIKIKPKNKKIKINEDLFFKIVKAGFGAKRKLLVNNLAKGLGVSKEEIYDIFKLLKISENVRAQDLGVAEWVGIFKALWQKNKNEI